MVEVLRDEVKRPTRWRPVSSAIRRRHLEIAAFVFDLKQKGARGYSVQAEKVFAIDRKQVQRAVESWPNMDEETADWVLVCTGRRKATLQDEGRGWRFVDRVEINAESLRGVFDGLSGLSAQAAADELNRRGIPAVDLGKWNPRLVNIVRNRIKGIPEQLDLSGTLSPT